MNNSLKHTIVIVGACIVIVFLILSCLVTKDIFDFKREKWRHEMEGIRLDRIMTEKIFDEEIKKGKSVEQALKEANAFKWEY